MEQNNVVNLLQIDNIDDLIDCVNYKAKYKSHYITLNTNKAIFNLNDPKDFHWKYYPNQRIQTDGVSSYKNIQNIVGIRLTNVRLDAGSSSNNQKLFPWYNNDGTETPTLNTPILTLLIKEFDNQAIITGEGRKYHFMLTNLIASMGETEMETKGDGYYWFRHTIQQLESITINLAAPFYTIDLPIGFSYLKPSNVTYVTPNMFLMWHAFDASYVASDTIYIAGYTTDTPIIHKDFISYVNRQEGHIVTQKIPTFLRINVDTAHSGIVPSSLSYNASLDGIVMRVYNPKKKLLLDLEIISKE